MAPASPVRFLAFTGWEHSSTDFTPSPEKLFADLRGSRNKSDITRVRVRPRLNLHFVGLPRYSF